MQLTYRSL